MARGYPDFFGFPTFPWWGPAIEAEATVDVPAGETRILLTITGSGVLYEGQIFVQGFPLSLHDIGTLYIDGDEFLEVGFFGMIRDGFVSGSNLSHELTCYNDEVGRYIAKISGEIGYGIELRYDYKNNSAVDITVGSLLRYARRL